MLPEQKPSIWAGGKFLLANTELTRDDFRHRKSDSDITKLVEKPIKNYLYSVYWWIVWGRHKTRKKNRRKMFIFLLAMAVSVWDSSRSEVSSNGCFWISFLRAEAWSSSLFSVMVHDWDNAEESIGKITCFNQRFSRRYLNNGPMQKKRTGQAFSS